MGFALVVGIHAHLLDGKVLLRESLDDVLPASIPTLRLDPQSDDLLQLLWFSETEQKLQKQLVRILTAKARALQRRTTDTGVQLLQGFVFDQTAETQHGSDELWSLPGDAGPAHKIHFLADRVLVQGRERLSVLIRQQVNSNTHKKWALVSSSASLGPAAIRSISSYGLCRDLRDWICLQRYPTTLTILVHLKRDSH